MAAIASQSLLRYRLLPVERDDDAVMRQMGIVERRRADLRGKCRRFPEQVVMRKSARKALTRQIRTLTRAKARSTGKLSGSSANAAIPPNSARRVPGPCAAEMAEARMPVGGARGPPA